MRWSPLSWSEIRHTPPASRSMMGCDVRLLKKGLAATLVAAMVVAAGCGGGGGSGGGDGGGGGSGGSGGIDPGAGAPTPSASFSDVATAYSAGRVVSLDVENFALTDDLLVTVGGARVPAQIIDGRVVFVLPVDASGAQTVVLTNSARSVSVPVSIEALVAPADPVAYVSNVHVQLDALLDDLIADALGDELTMLTWAKNELKGQYDSLAEIDAESLEQMAALLKANGIEDILAASSTQQSLSMWRKADLALCNELSNKYPNIFAAAILSTGVVVAGLFPPSPLALVGIAAMAVTVKKARGVVGEIVDACLNPFGEPLLRDIGESASVGGAATLQKIQLGLPFNHGRARTFEVETEARLLDVVGDSLVTLSHRLGSMLRYAHESSSLFAAGVPADVHNSLLSVTNTMIIPAEANTYALTGISDSRITGAVSASGSQLTLTFSYRDGQAPSSIQNFEFNLSDVTTSAVVGTYGATLNALNVPVAHGGAINVRYGETYTGRLGASYGDRFEIVSQPLRGTVTLLDAQTGEFSYHTTSQEDLPDQFSYRAVNAAGSSEPAMVDVSIDMTPVYEAAAVGTWSVVSPDSSYTMILSSNGTGYYAVDDTNYRIEWYVSRDSDGYKLYEYGFWHYAYDGLPRTALTLPITSFTRDSLSGQTTYTKH